MDSQVRGEINRIIDFIYHIAPDVRVVNSGDIYESERANLDVYPPLQWSEDQCLELQSLITEQLVETLINYGYLILAYVHTAEQQVQIAQAELESATRTALSARKVLSTARDLGIISVEPTRAELAIV